MPYYPDYCHDTPEDLTRRFSPDPIIRKEWARGEALNRQCHEILKRARGSGPLYPFTGRAFENGEANIATVYERFYFYAWLDQGGGFVGRNVTIFQAALLQPEEYCGPFPNSDGSIDGVHTGKSFLTLLSYLLKNEHTEKSILLHQDMSGRSVLHIAELTGHSLEGPVVKSLLDALENEPDLKKKLLCMRDRRGRIAYANDAEQNNDKTGNNAPSETCILL